MLTLMLKKLGYQVSVCTASLDAIELFRADPRRFQLVITDLTMPNMTGDRLCAELKKIDPDIPVILCTGFSERITPEIIQSIGIDGFVKKPVLKRDIAILIRKILDRRCLPVHSE
jgi:CheY-like chemotaxis protein